MPNDECPTPNIGVWATQVQIAVVFCVERSVVTKHIRNIFKDKELDKKAVCAKFARTAEECIIHHALYIR
jgi:hypothetical protein